jgi:hypothetical protein
MCGARLQACRVDSRVDVWQSHHSNPSRPQEAIIVNQPINALGENNITTRLFPPAPAVALSPATA